MSQFSSAVIQPDSIPKHIAIIMDGNRRWAKEHGLPVIEGHRRVAGPVLEKLIEHAVRRGISYLTLWAFSTENWQREKNEVAGIMGILRQGFSLYGAKMHKQGICIRVIGDISRLEPDMQKSIQQLVHLTGNNTRITVVFALNYGGRDEIVRAVNSVIRDMGYARSSADENNKHISSPVSNITENDFSKHLDTAGIPDPDFIIRTGGEERLSGFLPWQSQYSEFYFPSFYMPDFTPERLDEALEIYASRKRRFGK